MDLIKEILASLFPVFKITWLIISKYYGWVLIIFFVVKALFALYLKEIEHQFVHSQEWIFLHIRPPRENLVSSLAVENVFYQMHAIFGGLSKANIYIEGKTQLWYSLELVSLGGKISYIMRIPKDSKHLVEASLYAQYADIEVTEVDDYLKNLDFDPETSEFDLWGCEMGLEKGPFLPIKTYKDFEHPSAEEKIIDPINPLLESLAKMDSGEFFGVQIIIQPIGDGQWKPQGELFVKSMIGEAIPHEEKISDIFLAPIRWAAHFSFKSLILGGGHGHGDEGPKPVNNWQNMTDTEKLRVGLVEKKIGKPGYKTKMRLMYIAKKDKFDGSKNAGVVGSFRPFGSEMTNKISPAWGTGEGWKYSPSLEAPFILKRMKKKKIRHFKGYKLRDIHLGLPMFLLNTEELATIYHFPLTNTPVPASVERMASKKSQAPSNLPIVPDYV